ncbi:MAG: hypothetical protein WCJ35_25925, partial [Planctomycetota bacterium]
VGPMPDRSAVSIATVGRSRPVEGVSLSLPRSQPAESHASPVSTPSFCTCRPWAHTLEWPRYWFARTSIQAAFGAEFGSAGLPADEGRASDPQ